MRTPFNKVRELIPRQRPEPRHDPPAFSGLHWLAAGLFLTTGLQATRPLAGQRTARRTATIRRLPLAIAPLAGAAQIAHAMRPGPATRNASRVLNGLALGIAAAEIAAVTVDALTPDGRAAPWHGGGRIARGGWANLAAPLAFGATGALGMIIEREERLEAARRTKRGHDGRILDRIMPRRRPRVERVVVHV